MHAVPHALCDFKFMFTYLSRSVISNIGQPVNLVSWNKNTVFFRPLHVILRQASGMVEEVRSAFKRNLPDLGWMDDETRNAAKQKVSDPKNDFGKKKEKQCMHEESCCTHHAAHTDTVRAWKHL